MNLSIVIVSFNTKDVLRNCLKSVFENLPKSSEVIVVDNNSHDGSPEMVISDFSLVRLIKNNDNQGFSKANNQGLKVAKGKNLLILNSDTIVLGNALEEMNDFLLSAEDYSGCSCKLLNQDKSLQISAFKLPSLWSTFIHYTQPLRLLFPSFINYYPVDRFSGDFDADYISGACLMITKKAFEKVGGLEERFFFYLEDVDWSKRLNDFLPIRYLHKPQIIHLGGGSASRLSEWSILQHRRSFLLYFKIHYGLSGLLILRILFTFSFLLNTLFSLIQIIRGNNLKTEVLKVVIDFKAVFCPAGGRQVN